MGPSQALTHLVVLLLLLISSSASVVQDTCRSFGASNPDIGYDYCVKFFEGDEGSATADKRGLAVNAAKISGATAESTARRIAALKASEKDKKVLLGLGDCEELYYDAMDRLGMAMVGVQFGKSKGLFDARTNLSTAADAPQDCEDGFQELGVKSPLAEEDSEFYRQATVALGVTSSM